MSDFSKRLDREAKDKRSQLCICCRSEDPIPARIDEYVAWRRETRSCLGVETLRVILEEELPGGAIPGHTSIRNHITRCLDAKDIFTR
ncbi:hypothetical protein [uncultured Mediterranean phage]|nr:hypothetical protein [uncultured Mediterranean phage]